MTKVDRRRREHQDRAACGTCGRETSVAGLKMHRCSYIEVWLAANPDPSTWYCFFCEQPVPESAPAHSATQLNIHHLDGDHDNSALSNLAGAHHGGHTGFHMTGRPPTQRMRDAARKLMIGRQRGECECGTITTLAMLGRWHTPQGYMYRRIDA